MSESKTKMPVAAVPRDGDNARGLATRSRLLDAAERLIARDGLKALTFDNVAAEAGVAKGTVLYHFESKDALSAAMLERFVTRFDIAWGDAIASDPEPKGRAARAYLTATFGDPAQGEPPLTGADFDPVNGALTAALAETPERLEPVRLQGQRHQQALVQDGIDPAAATLIRAAIDGLWFAESYGLMRYDPALKARVIATLKEWTRNPPKIEA
ncbi:MAG: TetR/AcrR family transcriptional regulator [Rhizobiaceae bacterium]|nr:TetR/AcrR family transcriptional regulator [Rhizobiaceae bacterium]